VVDLVMNIAMKKHLARNI